MASDQKEQQKLTWPTAGSSWRDKKHPGRALTVTEVHPGDTKLERNVVGIVSWEGRHGDSDYACSLEVFRAVWTQP